MVGKLGQRLVLLILITLSAACTRPGADDAKARFIIQIPNTSQSASANLSAASYTPGWGLLDPVSTNDLNCFAVLIGGSGLSSQKCYDPADNVVETIGAFSGGVSRGSNIDLEVLSGKGRRIILLGFKAASVAACKSFGVHPDFSNLSVPQEVGVATQDLVPGANNISISVSLSSGVKINRCDFSDKPTGTAVSSRIAIGQSNNTANDNTRYGLSLPGGGKIAGGKLFVADTGNSRVLIWNSVPTTNHVPPDVVLGQPDFSAVQPNYGANVNEATSKSMNLPGSVTSDGTKLFVSDTGNHRVLIWNSIPTTNFKPADVVLGQTDFLGIYSNSGSTTHFNAPNGIQVIGTRLYVADTNNHRVLVWNTIPTTNGAPADMVLGQPNPGTTITATANNRLAYPKGIAACGDDLWVADYGSNRVMKWESISTLASLDSTAAVVIGQTSFTSSTAATSSYRLSGPTDVVCAGSKLAVLDAMSNRVMVWNTTPATNGASADAALGQASFTNNASGLDSIHFYTGHMGAHLGLISDGAKLLLSDAWNNRILGWNSFSFSTGQPASFVLGQTAFTNDMMNSPLLSHTAFFTPTSIATDGTHVAVADAGAHRVLLWNSIATMHTQDPDIVLGYSVLNEALSFGAVSDSNFDRPQGVAFAPSGELVVTDTGNNRLMIWNTFPIMNGQAADLQWGQDDFDSYWENGTFGTPSDTSLDQPSSVSFCPGGEMLVADTFNHRVLIFDSVPSAATDPASQVIGQNDFITASPNAGNGSTPTPYSVNEPNSVYCDVNEKVFVGDTQQHRVLIWNSLPLTNGESADVAVGANSLVTDDWLDDAFGPGWINGIYSTGNELYIMDYLYNRIMVWDNIPTRSGVAADRVLGKTSLVDFTNAETNKGGLAFGLNTPSSMLIYGGKKYIVDQGNSRVVIDP